MPARMRPDLFGGPDESRHTESVGDEQGVDPGEARDRQTQGKKEPVRRIGEGHLDEQETAGVRRSGLDRAGNEPRVLDLPEGRALACRGSAGARARRPRRRCGERAGWPAAGAPAEKASQSSRSPVCSGAVSVSRPSVMVTPAEKRYSSRSGTHAGLAPRLARGRCPRGPGPRDFVEAGRVRFRHAELRLERPRPSGPPGSIAVGGRRIERIFLQRTPGDTR